MDIDLSGLPVPPDETFDALVGLRRLEITDEIARGEVPVRREIMQPWGLVHGGVYASVAESLASWATAMAVIPGGDLALGQSNHTHFLRPISAGTIHALATRRHRGRTTLGVGRRHHRRRGPPLRDLARDDRRAPARRAGPGERSAAVAVGDRHRGGRGRTRAR